MVDPNADLFQRLHAAAERQDREISAIVEKLKGRHVNSYRDKIVALSLRRVVRHALMNTSPERLAKGKRRYAAVGLCVVGGSGAGKSKILGKCLADNPVFSVAGRDGHGAILVTVKAPKPSSLIALGKDILQRLGYPVEKKMTAPEVWRLVRSRLRHLGIMFLWIDEFQHVIDRKNPEDTREIRDTIKMLLEDEWPVYVILSGLPHIAEAIEDKTENDIQVIRRFRFKSMPEIDLMNETEKSMVFQFIERSAATAGLSLDFGIDDPLINRLHHAALHRLGVMIELVIEAVESALISNSPVLSSGDFVAVYEDRTGSSPKMNPFVVDDWNVLDCRSVLRENRDYETDGGADKKRRRVERPL